MTAPGIIRQEMPRLTPAIKTQAKDRGAIEVVIDELGRVAFAAVRASVHPMFDAELLSAARDWRYQPATMAGKAVKYRKMIQINVSRNQSSVIGHRSSVIGYRLSVIAHGHGHRRTARPLDVHFTAQPRPVSPVVRVAGKSHCTPPHDTSALPGGA